jgi:uncharacterized membrane protein
MHFTNVMDAVSKVVDAAGVGVIAIGLLVSTALFAWNKLKEWRSKEKTYGDESFRQLRESLGRSILLGLEFLIAGDIIRTVAVAPTFYNLGTLAVLVVIRSFLSWGLSMEIEGRWPWQPPRAGDRQTVGFREKPDAK